MVTYFSLVMVIVILIYNRTSQIGIVVFIMMPVLSTILFSVLTFNAGLLEVGGIDIVPHLGERAARLPAALVERLGNEPVSVLVLEEIWQDRHAQIITAALEPLGY